MAKVAAIAGVSALVGAGAVAAAIVLTRKPAPAPPQPVVIDVANAPDARDRDMPRRNTAAGAGGGGDADADAGAGAGANRVAINVPSRGEAPEYRQIGYLASDANPSVQINNILPLFGRQTYAGSSYWNFVVRTEAGVQIPLSVDGRDCGDAVPGCREMSDGDEIAVEALGTVFKVTLYNIDKLRYIPYV